MRQRLAAGAVAVLLGAGSVSVVSIANAPAASAATRASVLAAAASYAREKGYHIGIAVLDTKTGRSYGSGDDTGTFASESVIKVMIANRLIVQGRMHGTTERRAYRMITRSDDGIASAFYTSVGGDQLINWVKQRYHVWNLGYPPRHAGWWGNTRITPRGLVRYYARVKRDAKVAPWLLNAMHHAKPYGSDGVYQFFGLPQATSGFGIKQGWGCDYASGCDTSDFNTTGFVNNNRYAVAILARGPLKYYGRPISSMLSQTAKLLLPGGHFPDPVPTVRELTRTTGRVTGGQRIGIYGSSFTHVQAVLFGGVRGSSVDVIGPHHLRVTTPPHASGSYAVRVVTGHGTSPVTVRFRFIAAPAISSVRPPAGPTSGGTDVTITGARFTGATGVLFGGQRGTNLHVSSSTSMTVTVPPGQAGTVDVRVVTPYGTSPVVAADRFSYLAAPSVADVSPSSGPVGGGTLVTISGTGLGAVTSVSFGDVPATDFSVLSDSMLTARAPAHASGRVDVTVVTPGGSSAAVPADTFSFQG
jgi:hypothetical protein